MATILDAVRIAWEKSGLHIYRVRGMGGVNIGELLAGNRPLDLTVLEKVARVTELDLGIDISPAVLGARLREARQARGLTLAQAAAGIIRPEYLSLVELGRKRPALPTLQVLAERVGCDLGPVLSLPTGAVARELQGRARTGDRPADMAARPLPELDFQAFGAHLRGIRTFRGIPVRALAGGDASLAATFHRLEKGLVAPKVETVRRYTKALGLTVDLPLAPSTLGLRFRRRRRELGLSPDAASLDLGGRAYLARIESGKQAPSFEVLIKLAHRLDLPVGSVLSAAIVKRTRSHHRGEH